MTIRDRTAGAFLHAAPNITVDQLATFTEGRGPFEFHWEIPQLGPEFNNDSCFGCHAGNGRGLSQIGQSFDIDINGPNSQSLVRVSTDTGTPGAPGGPIPVPGFGLQLHDHSTTGFPQVEITLSWIEHPDTYADGTAFSLRSPMLTIQTPTGGFLPAGTRTSYRIAPPLVGLGLLAAVDDTTLQALADPDDSNGDGISGRVNMVWDPVAQATVVGRFGWKANTPTLAAQAAGAFVNDMGLTNKIFPETNGNRDVSDSQLDQVTYMISAIAVPIAGPRSSAAWHGRELFDQFQCARCHLPTLETGAAADPAVANQTIHPYTDLLLHDMGDLLTDARPDFLAQGVEWRTPALWGVGLAQVINPDATFLHDGRARTLAEAILWHGGEAMVAREQFQMASAADRDALIAFLSSL